MHQKMSGRYVYADVYVCFPWWHWFYALYNTKVLWPAYYEEVQNRVCTFWFFTPLCTFFPTFPICAWDLCNGFFALKRPAGPDQPTSRDLYIFVLPQVWLGQNIVHWTIELAETDQDFQGTIRIGEMSLPCAPDSSNMKDWSTLANFACMLLET